MGLHGLSGPLNERKGSSTSSIAPRNLTLTIVLNLSVSPTGWITVTKTTTTVHGA